MGTPSGIQAHTRIHMGASGFTIHSIVHDKAGVLLGEGKVVLRDPTKVELTRLGKELCELHGIKQPVAKKPKPAKRIHKDDKLSGSQQLRVVYYDPEATDFGPPYDESGTIDPEAWANLAGRM